MSPKGDMADLPKMPALADGWTIGKPDAVYSMTEDFKIPAAGTIEYKSIRIPVNLPADRWGLAWLSRRAQPRFACKPSRLRP